VALLVAGGAVCGAVVAGGLGEVLALVLISLGFVLATSLVFLEVGLSEDRERIREQRRREAKPKRRTHKRLDRMRGRSRRLK
jgi:UDP-N-acetylmuramyl pentapeptide phosphotransferase/UDP-N-acetylglucosamine-1-phosphate transferase